MRPVKPSAKEMVKLYRGLQDREVVDRENSETPGESKSFEEKCPNTTKPFHAQVYNTTSKADGSDIGRCIIINTEGYGSRSCGSFVDCENLQDLFGNKLGFSVEDPTNIEDINSHDTISKRIKNLEHQLEMATKFVENKSDFQLPSEEDTATEEILTGELSTRNYLKMLWTKMSQLQDGGWNTNKSMKSLLTDEIEQSEASSDYNKYQMFVLVLMAHGDNGSLLDPKGGDVKLADIYEMLSGDNFPKMKGKPKWVIVQACSGNRTLRVGDPSIVPSTSGTYPSIDKLQTGVQSNRVIKGGNQSIPAKVQLVKQWEHKKIGSDDIAVWLSSFPGSPAWRESGGSWFVRAILDVMHKHSHHMHLQQMFQRVQDKVRHYSFFDAESGSMDGGQHPTQLCTFPKGKRLYLFPKINDAISKNKKVNNTANTATTESTETKNSPETA